MRKKVFHSIFIICIGILVTILFTWPFVTKIATYYSDYGDLPLNGWILWYNQLALLTGKVLHQQSYFQTNQFSVFPYSLAYSDHMFFPSLIFTPFFLLSKNLIFSVNCYVFLCFLLSFLSMYYATQVFTKNTFASIVAGVIFTFNPLTYDHFHAGHYQLLGSYFLPILFLYAFLYIRQPNYKNASIFFFIFTLNALTSIYFFIFSTTVFLFFIPLCFLFTVIEKKKEQRTYLVQLGKTALVGLGFVPILWYFSFPYVQFSQQEHVVRSLSGLGAGPLDWIRPTPDSLLYGGIAKILDGNIQEYAYRGFSFGERILFPNVVPMMLFVFGVKYMIVRIKEKELQTSDFILFICYFFLLFITIIFATSPGFTIIYYLNPMIQGTRAPSRFIFLTYVSFSLFVAYGILYLQKYRYFVIIAIMLSIGIFVENIHIEIYTQTSDVSHISDTKKKIYTKLLHNQSTIHVPASWYDPAKESLYLNWDTITGELLFNGYSGYLPTDYIAFAEQLNNKLNEESIKRLLALDIHYIIFHKNLLDERFKKMHPKNQSLYEKAKIYEDQDVLILDLTRYRYSIPLCTLTKDLRMKIIGVNKGNISNQLQISNKNNCYLPSIGYDRYRKLPLSRNGKIIYTLVKFPLLIMPYEHVLIPTNH